MPTIWAHTVAMTTTASLQALAARRPLVIDDLPREHGGLRHELIDGRLFVSPLGDVPHQAMVGRIYAALLPHVPAGSLVLPGVNVILGERTLVIPDVGVVDPAHLVRSDLGVAPAGLLLAVEITSPTTRRRDLTDKRDLYRTWEVPLLIVDRSTDPHTFIRAGELPPWAGVLQPGL
jgi:Uma2 family endonuclease